MRSINTGVAWSVYVFVGHEHTPYKRTDLGAVWGIDSDGAGFPMWKGIFLEGGAFPCP